jgi:hypothetical protein
MPWIDGLSNVPEGGLKFNIKTVKRKGELILTLSLSDTTVLLADVWGLKRRNFNTNVAGCSLGVWGGGG